MKFFREASWFSEEQREHSVTDIGSGSQSASYLVSDFVKSLNLSEPQGAEMVKWA